MSKLIYCDTNIFMDYLEDRRDIRRPLGQFAFQLFQRTRDCEFDIVISDWLMFELRNHGCAEMVMPLLHRLEALGKIVFIRRCGQDERDAVRLPIPRSDSMHVVLAVRAGAVCLVTNNVRDFYPCSGIIRIIEPNLV
jgi:hypothetical protein